MSKQSRIIEILRKYSPKLQRDPAPDESLFESGLLDSFTLADIVGALEEEFSLRIPDSDLRPRKFDTVALIEEYVESHSQPA